MPKEDERKKEKKMINIIVHRSAGNESVGTMWHDSYQFEETTTLKEVLEKIGQEKQHITEDIIIPVARP